MTQLNTLLELRTKIKDKKPEFIRQDNPKRMKLSDKWRKPKGIHSKIRHHFNGRRKMPSPGYKSPVEVRGLHHSGLKPVNVSSVEDVVKIRKDMEGAIVSKSVGTKKKLEILKKAKELNVKILNLNLEEQINKIESFINSKKKSIEETKEKPRETKAEPKEKQELSDEKKKETMRKEKEKILTKRV